MADFTTDNIEEFAMNVKGREKTALFQNVKERVLTLDGAKGVYADILDYYATGLISERNMRALVYAMSNYLHYLKLEKDIQIEAEIENVKEILKGQGLLK